MSAKKYLPLKMIDSFYEEADGESIHHMLLRHGYLKEETTDEELTEFVFSGDFCDPQYHGTFSGINDFVMSDRVRTTLMSRYPEEAIRTLSYVTEVRDMIGMFPSVSLWTKHKQVYKIDPEFFDAVTQTSNLKLPEDTFKHLPVDYLYIDLSECKDALPIAGAFVQVTQGNQLAIYMVTDDEVFFSFYSAFQYENGIAEVEPNLVKANSFVAYQANKNITKVRNYTYDPRNNVVRAILQVLMFLSSQKPDIQENEITRRTYRQSARIKNKFSEIQMWDVGVRYGKAISLAKREAEKAERESEDSNAKPSISTRKSPRPHVRCAHWQRYHVGEGRKEIRTNWIPPVIVCGNSEIPVTIHKFGN